MRIVARRSHVRFSPGAAAHAGPALRPIAYCVMLACCELAAAAQPTGPTVVSGTAPMHGVGTRHLTITNSPGAIIDWHGFSIAAGNTTQFVQQSASSAVLNRVVGDVTRGIRPEISSINGQLLSNGRVFLINPAGIVIGPGGVIDTASFVGSTLNMLNADFLAGKLKFQAEGSTGSITNDGKVLARHGGDIVLIAPQIENGASGALQTEGGQLVLAAGRKLSITSARLEGVEFEVQAPGDSVVNVGKLLADGGAIGVFAGTLRHSGDARANALARDEGGRIVLKARSDVTLASGSNTTANGESGGNITIQSEAGTTLVAGKVSATGSDGKGGDIRALGERVGIIDRAAFDASGHRGGGQILVGGDYRGLNPSVQNAAGTFFGVDATLLADAKVTGDGGRIIVWGNDATRAYGTMSARGGALSGNGGFVETSGHYLDVLNGPDVSAPNGRGGTWLLDPFNITITAGTTTNNTGTPAFTPVGDDSQVSAGAIVARLNTNNSVIIDTAGGGAQPGDITVGSAIATTGGAGATLTLIADGTVNVSAPIDVNQHNVVITAGRAAGSAGGINLNNVGGVVIRTGRGGVDPGGNVTLTATRGNIVFNQGNPVGGAIVAAGDSDPGGDGNVILTATAGAIVNNFTTATALSRVNTLTIDAEQGLQGAQFVTSVRNISVTHGGAGTFVINNINPRTLTVNASAANSGGLLLTAAADQLLEVGGALTAGERVLLESDAVSITGTGSINAPAVTISPRQATTPIQFSAAADTVAPGASVMRLSNAELGLITATTGLRVGRFDAAGVTFLQAIAPNSIARLGVRSGSAVTQGTGATISVPSFEAEGSTVTLGEANVIPGIVAGRATAGSFSFSNTRPFVVGSVLDFAGLNATANVGLTTTGAGNTIGQSATGAVTANTLTVATAGANVTLDGATNAITSLGASDIGAGALRLLDAGGLTVIGAVAASGGVTLNTGGALAVNSPLNAGGSTASLTTTGGGAITQSAAGAITAGTLVLATTDANATLDTATNAVASLGATTLGTGALSLLDGGGLTVADAVDAGGGITLNTSGPLTVSNTLNANAGNVSLTTTGAGAAVAFTGSTVTGTALTLAGAGAVTFNSGSSAINSTYNTNLGTSVGGPGAGGTVNFQGVVTEGGTFTLTNGAANFNAAAASTIAGTMTVSGGTLGGTGAVDANGTFNWSGGTISGSGALTTNAATSITGPVDLQTRTWNNNGNLAQQGAGRITLTNGAVINNNATRNWTIDATSTEPTPIAQSGTGGTFENFGTFTNNANPGSPQALSPIFNNRAGGTVNVNNGTLILGQTPTADAGTYNVTNPGVLAFGGTRTLGGTSDVTGTGEARFTVGTVAVNGGYGIAATGTTTIAGGAAVFNTGVGGGLNFANPFTMSAGSLSGSDIITLNNTFTWSGGAVTGGAFDRLITTDTVDIANPVTLNTRAWNSTGTVNQTLAGRLTLVGSPTVTNTGIWQLSSTETNPITGPGVFNNAGTLNSNGPTAATVHTLSPTTFENTNTVNVTDGTLIIDASGIHTGTFDVAATKHLEFTGANTNTFRPAAALQGLGTIRFSGGNNVTVEGAIDDLNALEVAGAAVGISAGAVFNNVGSTTVSSGSLTLAEVAATDALTVSGGTVNVGAALTVNGPVDISLGALDVNANSTVAGALTLSGGTLSGASVLTINGTGSQWTGGTMSGVGETVFSGANTLAISGAASKFLSRRTLTTNGLTTWSDGDIGGGLGAVFNNNGTLDIRGNTNWTQAFGNFSDTIENAGAITRTLGTGVASLAFATVNGGGSIDAQTGTLRLSSADTGAVQTGTLGGAITLGAGATLDFAGANYIVPGAIAGPGNLAVSGGQFTANGPITATGALTIASGTATFNAHATALLPTSATVTGGTTDFNRTLTVNGAFNVAGGITRVNAPSTVNGLLALSGGSLGGSSTLTLDGGGAWTGGVLDGAGGGLLALPAGQTLTLSGAGQKRMTNGAQLNNGGIVDWSGGAIDVTNGSAITNAATGLFIAHGNTTLQVSGGTGSFVNNGIFRKTGGGDTLLNGALTFTSANTIDAQSGNLVFNTGDATFLPGTTFTGAGTTRLNNGALFDGAIPAANLELAGGAFTGTWSLPLGSAVNWTGGTLDGAGTTTIANGATLSIYGPGLKTVDNGHLLSIGGIAGWSETGNIDVRNGAQIATVAGGVFDVQNDQSMLRSAGAGTFDNAGTFRKTAGAATTGIAPAFNNNRGRVQVNSGTLRLTGGGTHTGAFEVTSDTLEFGGGTHALDPGSSFTGAGTVRVGAGQVNVNTPLVIANPFVLTGGNGVTLAGTGNLELSGPFTWSQGADMRGTGRLTTSGATTISDTQNGIDKNWTNTGAVTVDATGALDFFVGASTITNDGTFTLASTVAAPFSVFSGSGAFVNNGIFNKTGAGTQTISQTLFTNTATGSLIVSAGTLAFTALSPNAGVIELSNGAILRTNGAALVNNGTIGGVGTVDVGAATLTNSNIVRPGDAAGDVTGTLAVTGSYTQSAGAQLDVELGGAAANDFDVLAVSGNANLAGTLNVAKTGGYLTVAGDSFNVVTAGAVNGFFGTVVQQNFGREMGTAYSPSSAQLTMGTFVVNSWAVNADGNWNNPANWIERHVPLADERVLIDQPGNLTITLPAGAFSIDRLTSNENITIAGGDLVLANASTIAGALAMSAGSVGGAGPLTVTGPFALSGGTIASTGGVLVNGATTIAQGAPQLTGVLSTNVLDMTGGTLGIAGSGILTLRGPGTSRIANATLDNSGTVRYATPGDDLVIDNGAVLNNQAGGVFDIQGDLFARGAGSFNNAGTLTKSAGAGAGGFDGAGFSLTNTGAIRVAAGTLRTRGFPVNDGVLTIDAGAVFSTNGNALANAGTLRGNGTLAVGGATLTSRGIVAPGASPGMLVIDGNYVQTPTGTLAIDLGGTNPGVSYDRLQVNGNALLDGTLAVTYVNGYTPAAGDRFDFLTYTGRTGDFAFFHFPAGSSIRPAPGAIAYAVREESMTTFAGMTRLPEVEDPTLNGQLFERGPDTAERMERPRVSARQCE